MVPLHNPFNGARSVPFMHRLLYVATALLLVVPATGHLFNHEGRDVECAIWGAPDHFIGDGHAHTHNASEAAGLHDHDPCKQTGMAFPDWAPALPLPELSLRSALIGDGPGVPYLAEDEPYGFPFEELVEQTNLIAVGDNALAAQGFPGSGTAEDPYIIEGYLIRNVLQLKDTHACVVVRNNVIHSGAVQGEIIDPDDILLRIDELVAMQTLIDEAREALDLALLAQQDWQPVLDDLALRLDDLRAERTALRLAFDDLAEREAAYQTAQEDEAAQQQAIQDEIAALEAEAQSLRDAHAAATQALADQRAAEAAHTDQLAAIAAGEADLAQEAEELHAEFAAYQQAEAERVPEPPEPTLHGLIAYTQHANMAAEEEDWQARFSELEVAAADLLSQEQEARQAIDELRGAQRVSASEAQAAEEALGPVQDELGQRMEELEARRAAQDPPEDEDLRAEREALEADWRDFRLRFKDFRLERNAALAEQVARQDAADAAAAELDALVADADALALSIDEFPLEYLGTLYKTIEDILASVLAGIVPPNEGAGRLILDWNGQCLHVHGNLIEDLRVNRNNDRLGYATGGIIEQNRIGVVGQIRHYDGIFRHNEIGDRAHLEAMLDPEMEQPPSERAVNTDGFNQGWMHDNTIYGSIDLDFHGHHHGGGFFAPVSHYHGSLVTTAYMYDADTGQCQYMAPGDPTLEDRLGADNVVSVPDSRCLAHWDHGLRWTSVKFQDNTIIDPLGVGLRYEDRNHRGDDEQANSENMEELKRPHTHQTHIDLSGNAIVGTLRIDVFNADGTDLWSDDWSEVQTDGAGRVIDALLHPGAEIVNSHPGRNEGWLDIHDNVVVLHADGRMAAIHVNDAKEAERIAILGNQAFHVGSGFQSGLDPAGFLAWLDAPNGTQALEWGGETDAATGILPQRVKDSHVTICDNAFHGFTRGLQATQQVREDVTIRTCASNHWGDADPRIDVRFAPMPQEEPAPTEPARQVTDGTIAREAASPIYDAVDLLL